MDLSYKVEFIYKCNGVNRRQVKGYLKNTLKKYNEATDYLGKVVLENYESVKKINGATNKRAYMEKLIHTTKDHKASYDFDAKFPKFPSYFRRDAILKAIGHISSYQSNLANYEKECYEAMSNGKKFKKKAPSFNLTPNLIPTFF